MELFMQEQQRHIRSKDEKENTLAGRQIQSLCDEFVSKSVDKSTELG